MFKTFNCSFLEAIKKYASGLNNKGVVAVPVKYGYLFGAQAMVDGVTMAASITQVAGSSQFVTMDASGNCVMTAATSTSIFGHLIAPLPNTGSTTSAKDKFTVNIANDAVYIIPIITGTYSRANRGKLCDLVISTNKQGAACQVSTRGHLRILDGDETTANKYILASMNPGVLTAGNAS